MTLTIVKPGPQSTVQARPRLGRRHLGIPWAGPADALSHALANRLVGNGPEAPALEILLGDFEASFNESCSFALCGGEAEGFLDDQPVPLHRTLTARKGSRLKISHLKSGVRSYLALAGGIEAAALLGSVSTYLPAGLGGHHGRALLAGDILRRGEARPAPPLETPQELRPVFGSSVILRAVPSAEFAYLGGQGRRTLFEQSFTVSARSSRMGLRLEGLSPELEKGAAELPSGAVFPGTVQCPEGGTPIVLGPDAQVTGGYPRLLSVIRADLPLLGQLAPGAKLRFFMRSPEEARADRLGKRRLLESWLGEGWPYGLF